MTLNSVEEALVDELIDTGRTAVQQGLVQATGGNFSAREPGSDRFIITGSGTRLDRLSTEDFAVLSLVDGAVAGGCPRPSSEWMLHQRTYAARPDANAIIHVHPQYAILLDALGRRIRFLTLDHAYYVASVGRVPFHANGSTELAESAAAQMGAHNAVILANHGCSTVGEDISMAFRRASLLEEAAKMTFNALLLGDTTTTFGEDGIQLMHA